MKTIILMGRIAHEGNRPATIHSATFLLLLALLVLVNSCWPSEQAAAQSSPLGASGKAATPHQAVRNYFRAVISGNADGLTQCYVGTAEQMEVVRAQAESMSAMLAFRDVFVDRHGASAWGDFRAVSLIRANVEWTLEATQELDQLMIDYRIRTMKLRVSGDRAWVEGKLGTVRLVRRGSSWFIDLASVVPAGLTSASFADATRKFSEILVGLTAFARRRDVTPEDISSEFINRITSLEKEQTAPPD